MENNIKGAQLIIRIILDDDSIVVKRVETQKEYKNQSPAFLSEPEGLFGKWRGYL